MKTALSIRELPFGAAGHMARDSGASRSRLYAKPIQALFNSHHTKGAKDALDTVQGTKGLRFDLALATTQGAFFSREDR